MAPIEASDFTFNVSGLLKEGVGSTRIYEFHEPQLELDPATMARDVSGDVRLLRVNRGILAEGTVAADVTLACSRCLEPAESRLEVPFQEEYRPSIDILTGVPVSALQEGETEADFTRISQNHELDLQELIRQVLLVHLPYSPLCRSDCAGICPECGTQLNSGSCDCVHTRPDARLAGLAALLDEMEDERRA